VQLAGGGHSGDTPAPRDRFRALYESTFPEIYAFVARRHRLGVEIDDVVAETYLSAWRRIDDVPVPPGDRLWMYGVARNTLGSNDPIDDEAASSLV
jgi:RNA polymerase sigma-70 factor, ECF subfamily